MPQSRHRKTAKGRKRNKGLYSANKPKPPAGRNRQVRIVAIVVVLALAATAIIYMLKNRAGGSSAAEVTTASGLKYTDLVVGTGATPQRGQTVTVHYIGSLENGKEFNNSRTGGKPVDFRIGQLIPGWDEALMSMKVGGRRKLVVPPALAYGPQGKLPDIPPNATLIFDLELLGVK